MTLVHGSVRNDAGAWAVLHGPKAVMPDLIRHPFETIGFRIKSGMTLTRERNRNDDAVHRGWNDAAHERVHDAGAWAALQ